MVCDAVVGNPSSVFSCNHHQPLKGMRSWELLVLMLERGWTWRQWKPKSQQRKKDPIPEGYTVGSEMVFYSTNIINDTYLRLLLDADAHFAAGLAMVPHGLDDKAYKKIMGGNYDLGGALEDGPDIDLPQGVAVPMLAPSFDVAHIAQEVAGTDVACLGDVHVDWAQALEEALGLEQVEDEEVQDEVQDEEAVAVAAVVAVPEEDVGAGDDALLEPQLGTGGFWGPYRLTYKDAGPYGTLQATCLWHKKSRTTPACRKTLAMEGPTQWHREVVARRLCWWLAKGKDFSRQRTHKTFQALFVLCPPVAMIQALKPDRSDVPNLKDVRTDEDLDMHRVPEEVLPPESFAVCAANEAASTG